jgi:hypothetical protein
MSPRSKARDFLCVRFPVGRFTYACGGHVEVVVFGDDGRVTVYVDGEQSAEARYSVSGHVVSHHGIDPASGDESPTLATYRRPCEDESLSFVLIKDSMDGRRKMHAMPWKRVD